MMNTDGRIIYGGPMGETFDPEGPSYAELILNDLKQYGDDVAQIFHTTGELITFRDIYTKSIHLAMAMKEIGIKKGDVVSISSENRFEFTICAIATMAMGCVYAPINLMYSKSELLHILGIFKPVIVFGSPTVLRNILDLSKGITTIKHVVTFGTEKHAEDEILLFSDFFTKPVNIGLFKPAKVNIFKHPAVILSSSGTTGLPKGVLLSHANLIICFSQMKVLEENNYLAGDYELSVVPWFHAYGFISHLNNLRFKRITVFVIKFEENEFLSAIEKYKIRSISLVPPLVTFLGKNPLVDKYDLSSLNTIWCGAAPLSGEIEEVVKKRIGVQTVLQGYGMTETTLSVLFHSRANSKPGSVGNIMPGMQVKVVDINTMEILGPKKEGELCFKGPLTMLGYVGDPKSTNQIYDSEGWLHTGDIGYYDEDEYFYIVDRLKELIKFKGFQVPPAELEALLLQNENVKDAAVIGIEDEAVGERPMAFIVKQPNSGVTEEEIIDFVAKRVSYPKRLHGGVRFMHAIPKSPSGKILRRELRDMMKRKKSKL